jgi:hypothetical protein
MRRTTKLILFVLFIVFYRNFLSIRDRSEPSVPLEGKLKNGRMDRNLPFVNLPPILQRKPRVAIISLFKGKANEVYSSTWHINQRYANKHGYSLIDPYKNPKIKPIMDNMRDEEAMMFKYYVVRFYLDDYDWVLWSDSDSIFLNHGLSLERSGCLDEDYDVIMPVGHAQDWTWGKIVNTGYIL